MKRIRIAIDGPAASGKSTTAKLVAERMGYVHLDTGAMYRAITSGVLQAGINIDDASDVQLFAEGADLVIEPSANRGFQIYLNGKDLSDEIRLPEVTKNVSTVSSYEAVRAVLVREQRKLAAEGGVVLEGRDIGTVVLPNAELKIYMVAEVSERARRRKRDLQNAGIVASELDVEKELLERDRKDSTRKASPLRKADDAVLLDTSNMTIERQVDFIVKRAEKVVEALGDTL